MNPLQQLHFLQTRRQFFGRSAAGRDEVLYQIYVRKQIDAGLKDEKEGRLIPHEWCLRNMLRRRIPHVKEEANE